MLKVEIIFRWNLEFLRFSLHLQFENLRTRVSFHEKETATETRRWWWKREGRKKKFMNSIMTFDTRALARFFAYFPFGSIISIIVDSRLRHLPFFVSKMNMKLSRKMTKTQLELICTILLFHFLDAKESFSSLSKACPISSLKMTENFNKLKFSSLVVVILIPWLFVHIFLPLKAFATPLQPQSELLFNLLYLHNSIPFRKSRDL